MAEIDASIGEYMRALFPSLNETMLNQKWITLSEKNLPPPNVYSCPVLLTATIIGAVLVVAGLIGNILLVVMYFHSRGNKSMSVYIACLAIIDSFAMTFVIVEMADLTLQYCDSTYHTMYKAFSSAGCRIFKFLIHVFFLESTYTMVMLTVERFFILYFPLRGRMYCRGKCRLLTYIAVMVLLATTQIFHLIYIDQSHYTAFIGNHPDSARLSMAYCTAPPKDSEIYSTLYNYLYILTLQYTIPAAIILICNISIYRKLCQVDNIFKLSPQDQLNSDSISRETSDAKSQGYTAAVYYSKCNSVVKMKRLSGVPSLVPPTRPQNALISNNHNSSRFTRYPSFSNQYNKVFIKRRRQATKIILIVTSIFILAFLGPMIGDIYQYWLLNMTGPLSFESKSVNVKNDVENQYASMKTYYSISPFLNCFRIVSYACNFYVYYIYGPAFRKAVQQLRVPLRQ